MNNIARLEEAATKRYGELISKHSNDLIVVTIGMCQLNYSYYSHKPSEYGSREPSKYGSRVYINDNLICRTSRAVPFPPKKLFKISENKLFNLLDPIKRLKIEVSSCKLDT